MYADHEFIELVKTCLPVYLLFALPLFIMLSPMPIDAATEFAVYRLQQYDLHGLSHGSRSSLVNLEARTLDSQNLARRCVIARLLDLSPVQYQRVISQAAAGLLVLLPYNLTSISRKKKEHILELEAVLLETETQLAVYFSPETPELTEIYSYIKSATVTDAAPTAAAALFNSFSADGYQLVVGRSQSKMINDMQIANIYGKLIGYGIEEKLPTIGIVAHYDTFGAAPELSFGADSNGSGVIVLLRLAQVLSKVYSSSRTHPKMNVVFLLAGGGYTNYQGSKRFLEDQLDASDSSVFSDPHFTICLDTLANGPSLYIHVSKKPKDSSPSSSFFETLHRVGEIHGVPVEMVHRKINLQEDRQAWEHEKYSMRRLPAFTLSRLQSPKTNERGSITDTWDGLDMVTLSKHTSVIANSLLWHIYNSSVGDLLLDSQEAEAESMKSWQSLLASQPRSPQLLAGENNALVHTLHQVLRRYTDESKVTWFAADRRDPEWLFYDVTKAVMAAYAVKPASFDFLLTLVILIYLGLIYLFLQFFPVLYIILNQLVAPHKIKGQ